jgi:anti-sigma factor RsiW
MFGKHNRAGACSALEARLEDYVEGRLNEREAEEVEIHVRSCARCTEALRHSRISVELFRALKTRPAPSPNPFFVSRVMAAIHGEQRDQDSWKPVERAAWRLCWVATVAVLVLAFFMLRIHFSPPAIAPSQQSQVQALVNVPVAQPANQDDSVLLLASDDNGR